MRGVWIASAALAALLHVLFFVVETLLFPSSAKIQAAFQATTPEKVEAMRVLFLNQGFYNLFLAIGVLAGLALATRGRDEAARVAGRTAVAFGCLVMVGAGVILVLSTGKVAGALAQAVPPTLALVCGHLAHEAPPQEG